MKNLGPLDKSSKFYSSKNQDIKTTDVNILLNRVRSNKRDDIKKKLYLITLIAIIFSALSFIVFI
tara:strand:- start:263 stop:457 length:195 start_codon:yes stop_codon:yes gene_type:complete